VFCFSTSWEEDFLAMNTFEAAVAADSTCDIHQYAMQMQPHTQQVVCCPNTYPPTGCLLLLSPSFTMTIPRSENTSNDGGEYQLLLETADILYSYSDTRVLSRFGSLSSANSAALPWLLKTLTKENLTAPPQDEIIETTLPGGELMLSCSSYVPPFPQHRLS
jgi:hypothetical protein